uniref:Venom peptide n=1 Tax=Comana monomorpha TaxID=1555636 RepID=A0AAU6PB13_9NEOP
MKTFIVVCLAVLAVATAKYTDKYDNTDVDEIMSNCRLMVPYAKCLLGDKKKCTKEGLELKEHVVDALQNECSECTDVQKEKTKRVIGCIYVKNQAIYKKVAALYDPKGDYEKKYQKELQEAAAAGDFENIPECDFDTERAKE